MDYLVKFHKHFKSQGDSDNAVAMSAYMKNRFQFLGIKSPQRKALLSEFIKSNGLPTQETIEGVMIGLWSFPYREYHYCGIELFQKIIKKSDVDKIHTIEYILEYNLWWDSVDGIASNLAGPHFKNHEHLLEQYFEKWLASDNMWLNRTTLIFQLKYGEQTNTELLTKAILRLKDSKEFFIQKAIGWSLRQYSKHNKEWVKKFISNQELAPLSVKEGSKYL